MTRTRNVGFAMGADYMLIPLMAAEQFGVNSLARAIDSLIREISGLASTAGESTGAGREKKKSRLST